MYHTVPSISGRNRVKLLGGSLSRRSEDIHKHPPPWTLSAWRHPPSEKLKNTPTLGDWRHLQAHPPSDIALVTSSTFQGGGGVTGPGHALFAYRFSVSGQVQGGGGGHPCHTHTRISHCYPKQKSWAKQRPSARPIIIMRFWRQSPTIMCHNVFVTLCYRDSLLF